MAALVTVSGRFELPDNTPAAPGSVVWTMVPGNVPDLTESVLVLEGPVRASLDETGSFTISLRATDDPDLTAHVDGDLSYHVQRTIAGVTTTWNLAVPAPGPWDWLELSPQPSSAGIIVQPVPGPVGPQGPKGDPGQWMQITQAAYNALNPPDPAILYVIVG
jgi:hypothetical protein